LSVRLIDVTLHLRSSLGSSLQRFLNFRRDYVGSGTLFSTHHSQWRAEGGERTGRRYRASKARGHPKSEITKM